MSNDETTLNVTGLDKLLKALKQKPPVARVGILGDKDVRSTGDSPSNATIGASHEFGTSKLPQRSFLRVPLSDKLTNEIGVSGALNEGVLKEVMAERSVIPWLRKIAILAEGIVSEAFDTGGFGKWKPSNMKYKKNHETLVETQQLRNSITSEVKEK